MRAEGFCTSTVEPGARRLTTDWPEVTRSGLIHPSGLVGPTAEKLDMVSPLGDSRPGRPTRTDRDDRGVVSGERISR